MKDPSLPAREIGLRMALGANPTTIIGAVVGGALRLVVVAFVPGIPLSLSAGSALRSLLFGLDAQDASTIAGACLVLAATAAAASLVPAGMASQIEPVKALRGQARHATYGQSKGDLLSSLQCPKERPPLTKDPRCCRARSTF